MRPALVLTPSGSGRESVSPRARNVESGQVDRGCPIVAGGGAAPLFEAFDAPLRDLEMELERQEWLHSGGRPERAHMLMTLEQAGLLGTTGAHHGAEGPLVLHEPEDTDALDYLNEYGEFFEMSLILMSHGMAPPRDLEAVPPSVQAHSALLRAVAWAGTLEGFDAGHAVLPAQAAPDAVLALADWNKAAPARSSR